MNNIIVSIVMAIRYLFDQSIEKVAGVIRTILMKIIVLPKKKNLYSILIYLI